MNPKTKKILKKGSKLLGKTAGSLLCVTATLAKNGLKVSDTLLGGATGMANSMASGISNKTPMKDLAFKGLGKGLDQVIKLGKWIKAKSK